MTATYETPVDFVDRRRPAPTAQSDVPVVEWLEAPLTETGEPTQGHQVEPDMVRRGDYLAEFHSNDTASWLRVSSVAVIEGQLEIWYGRGSGVPFRPVPGMRVWILRQDEALEILRGYARAADMTELQVRAAFEHVLRFSSLQDVVNAWDLVHAADAAEVDMDGAL